jgi:Transposase, Mutator family
MWPQYTGSSKSCRQCRHYSLSLKNFHRASRVLIVDAMVIFIAGVKYCEYLAIDTSLGLVHRHLRRGSECTWGYRAVFSALEEAGYALQAVVSDGGTGVHSTLRYFDIRIHQRCHVHLLRDLKVGLRMPSKCMRKNKRKWYVYQYAKLLLASRTYEQEQLRRKHFERATLRMWPIQGDGEKNTLKAFVRTLNKAYTYREHSHLNIPKTTNNVEGYISRVRARLKTTRGLKSSANAELLLNGIHVSLR